MSIAQDGREPATLDLRPMTTAGLGRLIAELEACRVRVRRRLKGAPTDGDREVAEAIGWFQRLVEFEADQRDRVTRAAK